VTPLLAAASGVLAFATVWELAGMGAPVKLRRATRSLGATLTGWLGASSQAGVASRLRRAGLDDRAGPTAFLAARGAGAFVGGTFAVVALPSAPSRLAPFVAVGFVAAGALIPDALVARAARRRAAAITAALPDALDLMAVGAAAGRSPAAMLAELARASSGPLARELAVTDAEIRAGQTQDRALGELAARSGIGELGVLAATLERSRLYGSPLADQLHARAGRLRADERRRIEEHAARSAPKIQLVVALLLVPSALLAIAAALVAHSETLLQALG
jgi:tight adherence protein C